MRNSLFSRLLISCSILIALFYILIYYAINQSYTSTLLTTKQKEVELQSYLLLSAANIDDDGISMPEEMRQPRFDDYESGLYGFITDIQGKPLWSSYSAHSIDFERTLLKTSKLSPGEKEFRDTQQYYISHHTVEWEFGEQPQLLTFTVLEDKAPTIEAINTFQRYISRWFIISALVLVITLFVTLRWGLYPLDKLALEIKRIESGYHKKLADKYPKELKGLTKNLNTLIDAEHKQRERYQNTLSDLAHSLKTPLAVTQAELESSKDSKAKEPLIAEQVLRMEEIITHQLQRAVMTSTNKFSEKIAVYNSVEKITPALEKVYQDKAIHFAFEIKENSYFRGDQRDLMEILGNIMDNACKACKNRIEVHSSISNSKLHIEVHDDGEGIPKEQRDSILKRGQRLDTKTSGQGIGLDVVRDIVDSYEGDIEIEQSSMGGALFRIILPA